MKKSNDHVKKVLFGGALFIMGFLFSYKYGEYRYRPGIGAEMAGFVIFLDGVIHGLIPKLKKNKKDIGSK